MKWIDIRKAYPDKWVVVEGLKTRMQGDTKYFDKVSIMESFDDGTKAMKLCNRLHKEYPRRDFHFIHTSYEKLKIPLKRWIGIRG